MPRGWGWVGLGDGDHHIHTANAAREMDAIRPRALGLGLMPAGDPNGKEVHRDGTRECTADSLC